MLLKSIQRSNLVAVLAVGGVIMGCGHVIGANPNADVIGTWKIDASGVKKTGNPSMDALLDNAIKKLRLVYKKDYTFTIGDPTNPSGKGTYTFAKNVVSMQITSPVAAGQDLKKLATTATLSADKKKLTLQSPSSSDTTPFLRE